MYSTDTSSFCLPENVVSVPHVLAFGFNRGHWHGNKRTANCFDAFHLEKHTFLHECLDAISRSKDDCDLASRGNVINVYPAIAHVSGLNPRSVSALFGCPELILVSAPSRKPLWTKCHEEEMNSWRQLWGNCSVWEWPLEGQWTGSETSWRYVQFTSASLNHWISRGHLPPLLSNRSSVSSSLCSQRGGEAY